MDGLILGVSALRKRSARLSEENEQIRDELRKLRAEQEGPQTHTGTVRAGQTGTVGRPRRRSQTALR